MTSAETIPSANVGERLQQAKKKPSATSYGDGVSIDIIYANSNLPQANSQQPIVFMSKKV